MVLRGNAGILSARKLYLLILIRSMVEKPDKQLEVHMILSLDKLSMNTLANLCYHIES